MIRMHSIIILFIILCTLYYIFFQQSKEHYVTSIVAYNNVEIPQYHVPSLFDTETKELTKLFKDMSKDNDFKIDKYNPQNPYLTFPFNNHIKKFILDFMKKNVDKFKGHKLEITTDLNEIYWLDVGQDRIFNFNFDLIDNTKFMTRNIQMKLKIKNIQKYIKDSSDYYAGEDVKEPLTNYKTDVPVATFANDVEILGMQLGRNLVVRFNITGVDKLDSPYYQIKNILGLMDPFVTSGRDMTISGKMKKDFEQDIKDHQSLLDILSGKKKANT